MSEENAMRQICSFLYEDVIHDLRRIMTEWLMVSAAILWCLSAS